MENGVSSLKPAVSVNYDVIVTRGARSEVPTTTSLSIDQRPVI